MSIATQITALTTDKTNIANAILAKNGTVNTGDGFDNFAADIATIPTGGSTEDVSPLYINGTTLTKRIANLPTGCFDNVTIIDGYALYYAYRKCTAVTSVSFPALTTVNYYGLYYAFMESGINTAVTFPALTTIEVGGLSDCFQNTSITSISFPVLTTAKGSGLNTVCGGCTSLTSASFPALTNIAQSGVLGYAFYGCTGLTTLSFPALTTSSFGSYRNQFDSMLSGVTGCTVHFPSAIQSTIGSWTSVTNGFGGTNTTVLFDL